MLTVGLESLPGSIVEVMPAALEHFGVALPAYARAPAGHEETERSWRGFCDVVGSATSGCSPRSPRCPASSSSRPS